MSNISLEKNLYNFGISKIQSKIYLHLVSNPNSSPFSISRKLNIPRTSVYNNLQSLINKGLIETSIKYKSKSYKAYPITILEQEIKAKQKEISKLSKSLKYLELNISNTDTPQTATEVRYYHGKQGLQQMMWNALSAEKETVGYSVYGRVEIVGKDFIKNWVNEFESRGLKDRVIINPTKETLKTIKKDVKPGKHQNLIDDIRYIDKKMVAVSGDITIYNNTFATAYWKDKEIVGIEIENEGFAKTQKTIFETLYKQAKPVNSLLANSKLFNVSKT